ncbi:MAG: type II secretion system F family protein [Bryobacteraceae bacterium]
MTLLSALLIFVLVAGLCAAVGLRVWVKPQEAIERVTGATVARSEVSPSHPSLALHELVRKLGDLLPASPKELTVMQRRLVRGGFRQPQALKMLYGSKVLLGVLLPLMMSLAVYRSGSAPENKAIAIAAAAAAGFFGPNEFVARMGRRRQKQIARGLPNALDLMVVCVESGLGLDQAIVQVAKELENAHREITEEFTMVSLELKGGKRRVDALRNLADRNSCDDLKKLIAVLIQADRFGTGIAQSLRAHADYMRVQARQVAEEKAAKLGVKLIFPIFFCILPSLFVVTVGPVAVKIVRELVPMMNNL